MQNLKIWMTLLCNLWLPFFFPCTYTHTHKRIQIYKCSIIQADVPVDQMQIQYSVASSISESFKQSETTISYSLFDSGYLQYTSEKGFRSKRSNCLHAMAWPINFRSAAKLALIFFLWCHFWIVLTAKCSFYHRWQNGDEKQRFIKERVRAILPVSSFLWLRLDRRQYLPDLTRSNVGQWWQAPCPFSLLLAPFAATWVDPIIGVFGLCVYPQRKRVWHISKLSLWEDKDMERKLEDERNRSVSSFASRPIRWFHSIFQRSPYPSADHLNVPRRVQTAIIQCTVIFSWQYVLHRTSRPDTAKVIHQHWTNPYSSDHGICLGRDFPLSQTQT